MRSNIELTGELSGRLLRQGECILGRCFVREDFSFPNKYSRLLLTTALVLF